MIFLISIVLLQAIWTSHSIPSTPQGAFNPSTLSSIHPSNHSLEEHLRRKNLHLRATKQKNNSTTDIEVQQQGSRTWKPPSNCTEEQWREKTCLHGGVCFVDFVADFRVIRCECHNGYLGDHCEIMSSSALIEQYKTILIPTTTIVVFILVFIALGLMWFHNKKKTKKSPEI